MTLRRSTYAENDAKQRQFRDHMKAAKERMNANGHDMGNGVLIAPNPPYTHASRSACRKCGRRLTVSGNVKSGDYEVQETDEACPGEKK